MSVAARLGDIFKMSEPVDIRVISDEYLPAPDLTICPIPGAVHNKADDGFLDLMFRHHARQVGVVMLNSNRGHPGCF